METELDKFFKEADAEVARTSGRAISLNPLHGREFYALWGNESATSTLLSEGIDDRYDVTAIISEAILKPDDIKKLKQPFSVKTLDTHEEYECISVAPSNQGWRLELTKRDDDYGR